MLCLEADSGLGPVCIPRNRETNKRAFRNAVACFSGTSIIWPPSETPWRVKLGLQISVPVWGGVCDQQGLCGNRWLCAHPKAQAGFEVGTGCWQHPPFPGEPSWELIPAGTFPIYYLQVSRDLHVKPATPYLISPLPQSLWTCCFAPRHLGHESGHGVGEPQSFFGVIKFHACVVPTAHGRPQEWAAGARRVLVPREGIPQGLPWAAAAPQKGKRKRFQA